MFKILLITLAVLSSNYYQAEAVQCYSCTSYMQACADPINTSALQYNIEPNCQTSCYVYTSGGVTYRGCSDGLGCFDVRSTTTGAVTCGGVTYNLCNNNLCNIGSGASSAAVAPTAAPTTAAPTAAVTSTIQIVTTRVPTAAPTTAFPTTAFPTTAFPTTAVPTTAVPTTASGCVNAASCATAKSSDCTSSFVSSLCPVLCNRCGTTAQPTTTFTTTTTTTTTTTRTTTTQAPCVNAASCANAVPSDCSSSFVKTVCPAFCGTCGSATTVAISTTSTAFPTTTTQKPTTTAVPTTSTAFPTTTTQKPTTTAIPTTTTSRPTTTAAPTTTTTAAPTTTTTVAPTTTTACPALSCKNSATFNGVTCKCDCLPGTTGTLCETLDCTSDSLGTPTCVDYNTQYALCADAAMSVYCIKTCNLCATSTQLPTTSTAIPTTTTTTQKPTTTTFTQTTTSTTTTRPTTTTTTTSGVSTPCVAKTCQNSGTWNQATCQCDCVPGTLGPLCQTLECNSDSYGASTCASFQSLYAICSDPINNIYCIKTCNLCATTVPPV